MATLLLSDKHSDEKGLSEHVILEIQQRSDARVFWKHYCHVEEEQVEAALEYGDCAKFVYKRPSRGASN